VLVSSAVVVPLNVVLLSDTSVKVIVELADVAKIVSEGVKPVNRSIWLVVNGIVVSDKPFDVESSGVVAIAVTVSVDVTSVVVNSVVDSVKFSSLLVVGVSSMIRKNHQIYEDYYVK
jgi:hypothetical protein